MPAGGCRSILGQSHGRCQPLCHTCDMGDNYDQGYSVSLLHLGRASSVLESSSKQANVLFVGCAGFSSFVCIQFWYREGNLSGKRTQKLVRDLVYYAFLSLVEKKMKKTKPMTSCLLYHRAKVSWSDGLVPFVCFPSGPAEPGQ